MTSGAAFPATPRTPAEDRAHWERTADRTVEVYRQASTAMRNDLEGMRA